MVLPNDPDLVDILAKNGVDISVSEGEQQGNYVALLGNLLFPLIAFGGLFFLFRGAGGQVWLIVKRNGISDRRFCGACRRLWQDSALARCDDTHRLERFC